MRSLTFVYVFLIQHCLSGANEDNDFSHPNEHMLSKNFFLHTFPALEKEWNISFEVNPSWYEEGAMNILH